MLIKQRPAVWPKKGSDSTTSEDAAGETDKKDDVEQPKKNKDEDEQMGGCGTSA